ncbi:MAG TPA: SDR family NAD(P)-dependent oxidoreductase [Puia sp.]|nr:SDR family NAD(P)-dependent oxidoreductase [Puia sp.]
MKTSNNTILITGGSAGIGFEFAKLFSADNRVIITGRSEERLKEAASKLKNVTAIVSDVSKGTDVEKLVATIYKDHPDLNVVINNAGRAHVYNFIGEDVNAFEKAGDEMMTNYLSIVRLNEKLLPLLKRKEEAAIVNVSSIVAVVPNGKMVGYGASKAALHSYSLSLRLLLSGSTGVKVFEIQPPLVDTEFSTEIGGHNGIAPSVVAEELKKGFENDTFEIRVGRTEDIYRLYLQSPEQALSAMNPLPQNA